MGCEPQSACRKYVGRISKHIGYSHKTAQDKAQVCQSGNLTNTQKESAPNTLLQRRRFCIRKAESHKALQGSSSTFTEYRWKKSKPPARKAIWCYVNGNFLNVIKITLLNCQERAVPVRYLYTVLRSSNNNFSLLKTPVNHLLFKQRYFLL